MDRTFLILHGYEGSPKGHWQSYLYEELIIRGENVLFPQLSNDKCPDKDIWVKEIHRVIEKIYGEIIVICHSLGSVSWLHYCEKYNPKNISQVILVAPAGPSFIARKDCIKNFLPIPLNSNVLKKVCENITLIASQNDFYCKEDATKIYGEVLSIDTITTPAHTGHINMESGFGKWDSFLEMSNILHDQYA